MRSPNLIPLIVIALFLTGTAFSATHENDDRFAGSSSCGSCHQQEFSDWQGSHHDLAMQHATAKTVLGNFNNTEFVYNGVRSTFFKRDGEFWVNTDGSQGELADFRINFTFGVYPLQQYLISFDDGRVQALSIAWDSRSEAEGGQRWYHLYPDLGVDNEDVLHWTRPAMNWNLQCAACHSTNLEKNYDQATNSYDTSWFEIDVACEACHGPGSAHEEWARSETQPQTNAYKGFDRSLSVVSLWMMEEGHVTATNKDIADTNSQIQTCASCHSRRSVISEHIGSELNTNFLDQHIPSHLTPETYHADGQILDEVYVYGSFIQSKMHQQGVTCTNCHNPHSLELKAPDNFVCAQCHIPTEFDTAEHHHHEQGSSGALCVNCHMPETVYMGVDARRDHSIRIPMPKLSAQLGVPNACNQCHTDQSVNWAVEAYDNWYDRSLGRSHPAFAFDAAINSPEESTYQLQNIAFNEQLTSMLRGSAISRMAAYPTQEAIGSAIKLLESEDAFIRFSAVGILENLPIEQRPQFIAPLMNDPVKSVRVETARLLAGLRPADATERAALEKLLSEYERSLSVNTDVPAGQAQLGGFYLSMQRYAEAEAAYLHALKLEPLYIPARLNLADLYRTQRAEPKVTAILLDGLASLPEQADLNFSLGLSFVRQGQLNNAIEPLKKASENAQGNSRYAYVYAVALYESGEKEAAINFLKTAVNQHSGNTELTSALVSYLDVNGRSTEADIYR